MRTVVGAIFAVRDCTTAAAVTRAVPVGHSVWLFLVASAAAAPALVMVGVMPKPWPAQPARFRAMHVGVTSAG